MNRNETSSKNILGSSWGPLNTSLVIWRGKIISKYSFYSLLSAFKNKHVFAITFHDSLRPVLKNGKNCTESFYFLFQIYYTIEQILYVWELHNDTFYIFTTFSVFSLCSGSDRFHQSPFLQLHLLFLLLEPLEDKREIFGLVFMSFYAWLFRNRL